MKKFSAKNKIIITLILWIALSVGMLMYGFTIFAESNQKSLFKLQEAKKELAALQEEKNSFVQAQKDVEQMKQESVQPQDFFSKDVTLVKELKTLEALQDTLGVKLAVSGVSGTARTAAKAKTQSDIVTIPYNINASGPYANIVRLVQTVENMPFVTTVNAISVSVGAKDEVNLSLGANFYLRRN